MQPVNGINSSLMQMAADAYTKPLLRALGAPAPQTIEGPVRASLFALHLAAAFYRLAIVLDVLRFYAERAHVSELEIAPLAMAIETLVGEQPRAVAEGLYRDALAVSPELAEAHYALACLLRDQHSDQHALESYAAALRFSPHPGTPAHAYLHANAHWERATMLEYLGSDVEALVEYRAALAKLDRFGVHHIRVARFFRRLGLLEDAAEQFHRCMTYSHRYFAEFILPPLTQPQPPAPPVIEMIHTNKRGEQIVFWQGAYFAVPQARAPVTPNELENFAGGEPQLPRKKSKKKGLLRRIRNLVDQTPRPIRRATSIAALEDDQSFRWDA